MIPFLLQLLVRNKV